MAKFFGPQFSIGIGKETTRATAVAASYWMPWASLSIDDVIKAAKDDTSHGVIEQNVGQDITQFTSKCTLDGNIDDQGFGLILKATLGSETSTAVAGDSTVYDHKFTVDESAQHPSLTLSVAGPNESTGLAYPLAMVEELQLNFELDKYANYKATFTANQSASQANTASFTSVNKLRPQDMTFTYASGLSGLGSGTTIQIKKFQATIKKNTEDDEVLGSSTPADRLNKGFEVTGSFELFYTDRTLIDNILLADAYQALQLVVANTGVTIGTSSNPTLTFRLARVKFEEIARKITMKDIAMQTVKFTAFYSISDTEMIDVTLRNLVSSAY